MSERKEAEVSAKKNPRISSNGLALYDIMEDGNGFEFKIANHNNPEICPQKGVIVIESLRRSNLKMPRTTFAKVTDPFTGITYGIPAGIDPKTKQMQFRRIILGEVDEFNMALPEDRKLWTVISRSTFLLGSPFQRGKPKYKKEDKEAEATKILIEAGSLKRAITIASDLSGLQLFDMAITFGLDPNTSSVNVLHSLLINKAKEKPVQFCETYDNANRQVLNIFNRSRSVGLIEQTIDQGFLFKKSLPLGMSEAAAINYIAKNTALAKQMDLESKQLSTAILDYATDEEINSSDFVATGEVPTIEDKGFMTDNDIKAETAKTREVRNQLIGELSDVQNLKAQLQEMINSAKGSAPVKDDSSAPLVSEATKKKDQLYNLQEEAFNLGWAPARECESVAVLKSQITKRKK